MERLNNNKNVRRFSVLQSEFSEPLTDLGTDVLTTILIFAVNKLEDIGTFRLVCKNWSDMLANPKVIFKISSLQSSNNWLSLLPGVASYNQNPSFECTLNLVEQFRDLGVHNNYLVTESDSGLQVWDLEKSLTLPIAQLLKKKDEEHIIIYLLILDESRVVWTTDYDVNLWNYQTNETYRLLDSSKSKLSNFITLSGKWLACSAKYRELAMWDLEKSINPIFSGPTNTYPSCGVICGDVLIAGYEDNGEVRVWNMNDGTLKENLCLGHTDTIYDVAVQGDVLITASDDFSVRLLSLKNMEHIATLTGHTKGICCLVVQDDSIATAAGAEIRVWSIKNRNCLHTFKHDRNVTILAIEGRVLVSGSEDTTVRVWDVRTGTQIAVLKANKEVDQVAIYRNLIIASTEDKCLIWDLNVLHNQILSK